MSEEKQIEIDLLSVACSMGISYSALKLILERYFPALQVNYYDGPNRKVIQYVTLVSIVGVGICIVQTQPRIMNHLILQRFARGGPLNQAIALFFMYGGFWGGTWIFAAVHNLF